MTNVLTGLTDGDITTSGVQGARMSSDDADSTDTSDAPGTDTDGTDTGDAPGTDSDGTDADSDSTDAADVDGTDG